MRTGGGRAELLDDRIVRLNGGGNDRRHFTADVLVEGLEEPLGEGIEDGVHILIVHIGEGNLIEVAREAVRNLVAAAAGGPHRAGEDNVDNVEKLARFAVVPALVVQVLAEELDGGLRAVLLEQGHVDVINEHDKLLANGRAPHLRARALAGLELREDQILRLVGARAGRESEEDGRHKLGGHTCHEELREDDALAGTCGANAERVNALAEEEAVDVSVAHDIRRRHNHLAKVSGSDERSEGRCALLPRDPPLLINDELIIVEEAKLWQEDLKAIVADLIAEESVELFA